MKTIILNKAMQVASGLIVAALLFSGCTKDDDITTNGSTGNQESNSVFKETLSQQEIDGLMYMVENEKLLRDYFTEMNDKFDLAVFKDVAESEQRHLDRLSVKFTRYDLENPADLTGVGEFVNPELQQYYNDLIAHGDGSAYAALSAGITKVKKDIEDMPDLINLVQGNPDIKQIYTVILIESQSNLSALVAEMKAKTILSSRPQSPVADF